MVHYFWRVDEISSSLFFQHFKDNWLLTWEFSLLTLPSPLKNFKINIKAKIEIDLEQIYKYRSLWLLDGGGSFLSGKGHAEYKILLKSMASFAIDFDGCKIKPKSQDVRNYDLTGSLIPVCHCIISSRWAAFFNIKSPLTNNVFWAQSMQNKLYQLSVPWDLDWKRAFSVHKSDVSHHMGIDWIIARFQSNYYIAVGP